ncbi:T9SS type A sorting domain-containing protein [bacterium]|nr:T9SS type A sorting domain-containing protein [bacterium]
MKCLVCLIFTAILGSLPAHAQWPVTETSGLPVATGRYTTPLAIHTEGLTGLSVFSFWRGASLNGTISFQRVSRGGELSWIADPNGVEAYSLDPWGDHALSASDPDGTTWLFFECMSGYAGDPELFGSQLLLQKLSPDGVPQWADYEYGLRIVAPFHGDDVPQWKRLLALAPLGDGSVYVVWKDDMGRWDYGGPAFFAQRYNTLGQPVWQEGGIQLIPDSSHVWGTGASKAVVLPGSHDLALIAGNSVVRITPHGSVVWGFGDCLLPGMMIRRWTKFLDVQDNGILVATGPCDDDSSRGYRISDSGDITASEPFYLPTYGGDEPVMCMTRTSDDGYSIFVEGYHVLLDENLTPAPNHDTQRLLPSTTHHCCAMDGQGISMLARPYLGEETDTTYLYGFDHYGTQLWRYPVYGARSINQGKVTRDEAGNSYVVWSADDTDEQSELLLANVVGPDGSWGTPSLGVKEQRYESTLPAHISLQTWPNPFNSHLNIRLTTPGRLRNVEVFDLLGRRIAVLQPEAGSSGHGLLTWDASGVASGTYYIQTNNGFGQSTQQRVVLLR